MRVGDFEGAVEQGVVGDDFLNQPQAQSRCRVDDLAGEEERHGPTRADQPGQELRAAAGGERADVDLGHAEAGRRAARRMSQAQARTNPPPRVNPLQAAITGKRESARARQSPCSMRWASSSQPGSRRNSRMSEPTLKARP